MFKRFVTTHRILTAKTQRTEEKGSRLSSFTAFCISAVKILEDPPIVPDTHRAEAHVQVREPDPEQARPGPEHMAPVQTTHTGVSSGADRLFRDLIQKSTDQMAEGMTPERITAEQNHVEGEHQRPYPEPEVPGTRGIREPKRAPGIMQEHQNEDESEIKKIPMDILQDERERGFARVPDPGFTHCTSWRVRPERLVICASVIITGEPEPCWRPKH